MTDEFESEDAMSSNEEWSRQFRLGMLAHLEQVEARQQDSGDATVSETSQTIRYFEGRLNPVDNTTTNTARKP